MENFINIKITNEELYSNKVIYVDTEGLYKNQGFVTGTLEIELENETLNFEGKHGKYDYEKEFGFIFK